MTNLDAPLSRLVRGKSLVSKLAHLGIGTVGDLLWYPPRRMYRWGELTRFDTLVPGTEVTLFAAVMSTQLGWTRRHDKAMFTVVLQDELGEASTLWGATRGRLTVRFFAKHPAALQFHASRLEKGTIGVFAGKLSGRVDGFGGSGEAFLAHPEYQVLQDYDPEVARELSLRPQPLYHATAGLPSWKIEGLITTILAGVEEIPEAIPEDLRARWGLPTAAEALQWLHHPPDEASHECALDYLRYREALTLGAALAKARQQARLRPAWASPAEVNGNGVISADSSPGGGSAGASGGGSGVMRCHSETAATSDKVDISGGGKTLVERFLAQLPFELTAGQLRAWQEISADMATEVPMNRLLQGEVGSGKTVIAALAAITAVQNGCQAAFMAPTEVLAHQHFETLKKLLGNLGCSPSGLDGTKPEGDVVGLRLLVGSTPAKEKSALQTALQTGEPLIVVGTHALLSKSVKFSKLGLAVVDEQHRFGVEQRVALLAAGQRAPHFLAMTATPIPRTVAMTVFGDLDVSVLAEIPRGRGEVKTFLVSEDNVAWVARAWRRAAEEILDGGRVYVLCAQKAPHEPVPGDTAEKPDTAPLAKPTTTVSLEEEFGGASGNVPTLAPGRVLHNVEDTFRRLQALPFFADTTITWVHSGLDSGAKQRAIADFVSGVAPLLVSTTVIEVGMDVPEASMMIILDADHFGLSQLHQLRGRIGRGVRPGVCLAIAPLSLADTPARERLEAFASTRDGFALAEADLRIRHEGDVLGDTQAGRNSRLQVLSLVQDAKIIEAAKQAAEEIVAEDAQLANHPELARLVFGLGQGGANLRKS